MRVIKRDGQVVDFDLSKIESAIRKAFASVSKDVDDGVLWSVRTRIQAKMDGDEIPVEEVQDIIEDTLMRMGHYDVAKSFILYRKKHAETREWVDKKLEFIDNYKGSSNTANATIDDNSNVGCKNIGVMNAEIHKQDNLVVNRRMIVDKLKELYPDFDYKSYERDLADHIIYKHDENSASGCLPYCVSMTMYPFLTNGIKGIGGLSAAPKNLDSFCGMYINLIFATSSMFAGAVATSEFGPYFNWFCQKEWGDDYWKHPDREITINTKRAKTIRSQIHQYWQQIIYSINQPAAARGMQSAFVNFSYFDKAFFEGMFGDFYFPDGSSPDWESLNWLQKEFMRWFNKERLRCMLTFPVESFALVYKDGKFVDEENARFVAEEYARGHSFFTYISDTVDSLSSCCFSGDTEVIIQQNGETMTLPFNKINGVSDLCVYSYGEMRKCKLVVLPNRAMYRIEFDNGQSIVVSDNHIHYVLKDKRYIEKTTTDLAIGETLPFEHIDGYMKPDGKIAIDNHKITSIQPITYDGDIYCFEMMDQDKPYFTLANGLITHNCRLKNMVQTKEFNFTNGNMGVQTGSKSVISLNLSRITQDWWNGTYGVPHGKITGDMRELINWRTLKSHLEEILERVYKYHTAYNELLWDMHNANLLPVYKSGFIDLDKQYLTVGLNGLNQAAEFLGIKCDDNEEYKKFCQFIFSVIKVANTAHKTKRTTFNTEQVPAESLAIKNYNWDKADGYWVPDDTNLYASYIFKPNEELSIMEKIRLHGKEYIGDYLDGGAAAHLNLDSHLTADQYWKIMNYAAEQGCQYFTFNIPNSECEDCGHITKVPIAKCPKCGSERISLYDRVIG